MIALILGGAPSVWSDLAEAQALLNRRHLVVATNHAGIHHDGPLHGWATLHPDLMAQWAAERAGRPAGRVFTPDRTPERWPGSSGLYAAQVALFELGATAAILCGVPMESAAGHFTGRTRWESTADYRQAFATALPTIGGRTRSMGGWTADLFGKPTEAWVEAVDNIKPLGATAPPHARSELMHHVKNTSETTQKFWSRNDTGLLKLVRLEPGQSGDFEIDPAQPRFAKGGALSITTPRSATPTPQAKPKD